VVSNPNDTPHNNDQKAKETDGKRVKRRNGIKDVVEENNKPIKREAVETSVALPAGCAYFILSV